MAVLDHILGVLRDAEASNQIVWQVAQREPRLLRLGQLYREYFGPQGRSSPKADKPRDAEIQRLEHLVGMAPVSSRAVSPNRDWSQHILLRLLEEPDPQYAPQAVLVAAQPGAGKGVIIEEICRYFARHGGNVVIDRNDLRSLHPDFAVAAQQDAQHLPAAIEADVARLAQAIIVQALAEHKHIILDEDFRAAASDPADVLRQLREAGYHTEVIALHVLPEFSWDNVQERYERQRRDEGVGRGVDQETHDQACRRLVDFLATAEDNGLADAIHVVTVFGDCLYPVAEPAGTQTIREVFADFPAAEEGGAAARTAVAPPPEHARDRSSRPAGAPPATAATPPPRDAGATSPPAPDGKAKRRGVTIIYKDGKPPERPVKNTGIPTPGKAGDHPAAVAPAGNTEANEAAVERRKQQRNKILDKAGRTPPQSGDE